MPSTVGTSMDPSMEKVRQERKQLLYLIEKEITELSLLGPSFHSQIPVVPINEGELAQLREGISHLSINELEEQQRALTERLKARSAQKGELLALLGIYRKAFQNMNAALQHQQTMGAQQQQQQHQQQQQQKVDGGNFASVTVSKLGRTATARDLQGQTYTSTEQFLAGEELTGEQVSRAKILKFLKSLPAAQGANLRALAKEAEIAEVGAGHVIFQESERPEGTYVLYSGSIEVQEQDASGKVIKQPGQREVYLNVGDLIGVSEENKSNAADRAYISRTLVQILCLPVDALKRH